jgi:guanine nucleotide-binding protein subunit alpha
MSVIPSPNPFIHNFLPREDEPPHERALREQEEARAKAVSDAIDEQIRQDKVAFKKYQRAIKLLLLGQSESGQLASVQDPPVANIHLPHARRKIHNNQKYTLFSELPSPCSD